jgi:hypothetical protein
VYIFLQNGFLHHPQHKTGLVGRQVTIVKFFNTENLVLGARSEYNGSAGTGANFFGVLVYWSTGVLEKMKARI